MLHELTRSPEKILATPSWATNTDKQVVVLYSGYQQQSQMSLSYLAAVAALAFSGTSVSFPHPILNWDKIGSPLSVHSASEKETLPSIPAMLQTVRKRTSLTWAQLAAILAVSRRAVHHWTNGSAVSSENSYKVRQLFADTVSVDEVEPFVARSRLLVQHGIAPTVSDRRARSEPILIADQSPLASKTGVRRVPRTRVRQG